MPATTSGSPERVNGAVHASPAPVPGMRWRREFPGEARQLAVLRRWLTALLPPSAARDDLVTAANELSSNAIVHTSSGRGGMFVVEITWCGPVVRVAVADGGGPGEPREVDDPGSVHGRGLRVVRGLSVRSGARGDHRGRTVWAEIRWADPGVVAPASPQHQHEAIQDSQAGPAGGLAAGMTWRGDAAVHCPAPDGGQPAQRAATTAARCYR
jgi:hypothetical protein